MIRRALVFSFAAVLSTGSPISTAIADPDSMQNAFQNGCLAYTSDLAQMGTVFSNEGWELLEGAGPGEFELVKGSMHMFVDASQIGCTVMDETVSRADAKSLLEASLGNAADGFRVENGFGGNPVWRATVNGVPIEIYVNEGLGGGSGLGMQKQN